MSGRRSILTWGDDGEFALDEARLELSRRGESIALRPKPYAVLCHLVRHRERVVDKNELFDAIWPGVVVSDSALTKTLKEIRAALGDSFRQPRFIQTHRGRGYRFIASVQEELDGYALGFANAVPATDREIRSIAVLSLQNLSTDPEQDYFAEGITEDLIGALNEISALRVPSHRSVLRYKGTAEPLPQIARDLDVDALIEGSVRREGDRVRVTVQLVRGADDHHLWHEQYDEDLRSILALQSQIARSVAHRVKATLQPREAERFASRRLVVPEAYDCYLRARQILRVRLIWSALEAIDPLEKAVELDPEFVDAHYWLGVAKRSAAAVQAPASEMMPSARVHTLKALELGSLEANVGMGWISLLYDWDPLRAYSYWQRALEALPGSEAAAAAGYGQGLILLARGEIDSGLRLMDRFSAAAPLFLVLREDFALNQARSRRFDEAIASAKALLRVEPALVTPYLVLRAAHGWKGEFDECVAATAELMKRQGADPTLALQIYRRQGPRAALRAGLQWDVSRRATRHVGSVVIAERYAQLGDADAAFEWLERAYAERDPNLLYVFNLYPSFDPVRNDERFSALAERLGIPVVEPDGPLAAPVPD